MGSELSKTASKSFPEPATTEVRIELDMGTDDTLDAWASIDDRSKRSQIAYIVKEVARAYRTDPFILHRIALLRSGTPAAAALVHA